MHRSTSDTLDTVDPLVPEPGGPEPSANPVRIGGTFEAFYRRDRDRLVRTLALQVGNSDLAGEAVDVAMSRAWQRWSDLGDHGDAGAWVYSVARNWAYSWFRRRRHLARGPVPEVAIAGQHARIEHADQLAPALAGLSDKYHEVVVLRMFTGFSVAETAAALDIPEGTVKSRLARALDQLRTTLEEQR